MLSITISCWLPLIFSRRPLTNDQFKKIRALKISGLILHPTYQRYLEGAGLDRSSVAGAAEWNEQIGRMYDEAREAMVELGIVLN